MQTPEFNIDDEVIFPGGALGTVLVVYVDRGEILVQFGDGTRELCKLAEVRIAPSDAIDSRTRYSA